jgi:hypothetical protein
MSISRRIQPYPNTHNTSRHDRIHGRFKERRKIASRERQTKDTLRLAPFISLHFYWLLLVLLILQYCNNTVEVVSVHESSYLLLYYRDISMHSTTTRLWYKVLGEVECRMTYCYHQDKPTVYSNIGACLLLYCHILLVNMM